MEVKIGLIDSPRELVIVTDRDRDEVEKVISDGLASGDGVVSLEDEKGRKYLVQAAKIAYAEIGAADARKVGFAPLT
ncbi:MAG: DUF3107 domain-containing protein [Rhodococcus sp.]|nr:DUF3107 domain-containing protein [Rhodococcus sp. (in: high G+C Gram-positive bacteria)]